MADDTEEWQPDPNLPVHPALQAKFRGFHTPEGQDWGAKAIAIIQAHNDARAIADQQSQRQQQFILNLDRTKQNLIGLVQKDPTALHMALQLASHTVDGLASTNPGLSEEDAAGAQDSVTSHMQQEIAHAAVRSMAGTSGPGAHAMLDRLGDVLPDADVAGLRQYTDNMTAIRQSDAQAQHMQLQAAAVRYSGATSLQHLDQLDGPNGELQFPPNWGQQMFSHPGLLNSDKAALWGAFDRLQKGGDAPSSDPSTIVSLLQRAALAPSEPAHPNMPDIISQVGNGLNVSDAKFLGGLIGPQPPQAREVTKLLADTVSGARDSIGNDNAFGRFMNWFLPATKAGTLDFDPASKNYAFTPERMDRFQPTGDDVIAPAVANVDPATRPSLGDIFGGRALANLGAAGLRAADDYYQGEQGPGAGLGSALGVASPMAPVVSGTMERIMNNDTGPNMLTTPEGQTYNPDTDA